MSPLYRFAHYLKSIVRDRIGSFTSRPGLENSLNSWLHRYVMPEDVMSIQSKAQFPLREARVEVTEAPGRPGVYRAVAFLRPQFQLDELTVSIRIVVELAAPH